MPHFKDCRQKFNPFESQARSATLMKLSTQNIYPINSASTGNNSLSFKLRTLSVSAYPQELFSACDSFSGDEVIRFARVLQRFLTPSLPLQILGFSWVARGVDFVVGFWLTWVGMKMESDIVQALDSSPRSFLHFSLHSVFFSYLSLYSLNCLKLAFFTHLSPVSSLFLSLLSCLVWWKWFEKNKTEERFCNEIYRNSSLRFHHSPLSPLQILMLHSRSFWLHVVSVLKSVEQFDRLRFE